MSNPFQTAGAALPPSDYAPLHTNRMVTGYWTNTNKLRDASVEEYTERFYGGRQDAINDGENVEISTRLTLVRRPGLSVYNSQNFYHVTRWYGWNVFDLTSESVRVMVDSGGAVYDCTGPNTKTLIYTKVSGEGSTYFLGVGNILYFTNSGSNKQLNNATGLVTDWGIPAPTKAPSVSQSVRPNPYPNWQPGVVYSATGEFGLAIISENFYLQSVVVFGTSGATEPVWNGNPYGFTQDGSLSWQNIGWMNWQPDYPYVYGQAVTGIVQTPAGGQRQIFWCINPGTSAGGEPTWQPNIGTLVGDGSDGLQWQNGGSTFPWVDTPSPNTLVVQAASIIDSNGYRQNVAQPGKSGATVPVWSTQVGALTYDGTIIWVNAGPFAVATTGPCQYGYAYQNSVNTDLSNMSPPSVQITLGEGGQIIVQGVGTGASGVDTIPIYRTAQGGSTFLLLDTIPNPGAGQTWTYTDNTPDNGLNPEVQALVNGEGTPLPLGATCLAYHLGRIWAAVGNVVYASSGPDAVVGGSNGNAGFDTTFTCQSSIKRFWVTPIGLIIFTVRDSYIIRGNGVPINISGGTGFSISTYIENIPLLNYDAFTVHLTTAYFLSGHRMVYALDPSAGILEASFPIAEQIADLNPATSYVTFHTGPTGETALYVSDGSTLWYRMAPTSTPESGTNWNPRAVFANGISAVQSVETSPGTFTLLVGPYGGFDPGPAPILQRDTSVNSDNGEDYPAFAQIGNIVLAHSGQLAGLAWMGVESTTDGSAVQLGVMLDEIEEILGSTSAYFYPVPRTRQDPPNMPPSESYYSNRHSLLQNQKPVWCKSLQLLFYWANEDAPNELLTYTIFGQIWQEQKSQ